MTWTSVPKDILDNHGDVTITIDIMAINNSLSPRTSGAITLWPTCNNQGGYYFLSLHSGKRINRNAWTELPMLNEVI